MNIALIGDCQVQGRAVAKAFQKIKVIPTLLVEDVAVAKQKMGQGYHYKRCDLASLSMLKNALIGIDSVYIGLTCLDEGSAKHLVSQLKNIVAACEFCDVKTIGFLSQERVSEKNAALFYEAFALYECEQLIKRSGINYFIFCPAPFMESLPQYVQNQQVHHFIKSPKPIHWLALKDYAQAVVKTYQHGGIKKARFILQGDHPLSLNEALKVYIQEVFRGVKHEEVDVFLSWLRITFMGNKQLLHGAKQARFLALASTIIDNNSEQGHWLLPSAKTQLKAWCHWQVLVKRQDQAALSA